MIANQFPLTSIILPTHNGVKYLKESIESCLTQSYQNIELIIVVDGSTDGTVELLSTFDDNRMIVIFHDVNVGLPSALNSGFKVAQGRYLTWTSDDNYYALNAIEEMVRALEDDAGTAFVYCDYWRIDDQGAITGNVSVGEIDGLVEQNCIGACFLYSREVYEKIGEYNPEYMLWEDYEYWLRIYREFRMRPLHKKLYYYRYHPSALSSRKGIEYYRWREEVKYKRKYIGWSNIRYLKEVSKIDIDQSFRYYQECDYVQVPKFILRGVIRNPSWLSNRGVWSIFVKSIRKTFFTTNKP